MSSHTPLSPAQYAVWVATIVDPDAAGDYHLAAATWFDSSRDRAALVRAIEQTLRSVDRLSQTVILDDDGEPVWAEGLPIGELAVVDLRDSDDQDRAVLDRTELLRSQVGVGPESPLHRHELLELADGYVWAQAYHHVLVDWRSMNELTRRVVERLDGPGAGQAAPGDAPAVITPTPTSTTADDESAAYWDGVLTPLGSADDGLLERVTPGISQVEHPLDAGLAGPLRDLAERAGMSPGRLLAGLLSAYATSLRGPGAHATRLAISGHGPRDEIAMRSSVVPVLVEVDRATTVTEYLQSFDRAMSEGRSHRELASRVLPGVLRARFGEPTLTAPGVNVMLGQAPRESEVQDAAGGSGGRHDGVLRIVHGPCTDIDLRVSGTTSLSDLTITARGHADADELGSHASGAAAFLASALAAPDLPLSRHRLVDDRTERRLLVEHNDTGRCVAQTDVVAMIYAHAARAPQATAVVDDGRALDYLTLTGAATHLARRLRAEFGVSQEAVVAVDMHRSAEMAAALVGIMSAGGAFVPLDPAWPANRRAAVLADAGAVAVVTGPGAGPNTGYPTLDVDLAERDEPVDLTADRDPESLAYVIFTSGSSGRPKGAMIRHGAIASRMRWQIESVLHFGTEDASLFKAPLSFDISINEVLLPLCSGGKVVVARDGEEREPERLLHLIGEHGVTFTYLVASMLDVLLDTDAAAEQGVARMRGLRHVWCGGELLTPELFSRFRRQLPAATMYHGYGPAEATIGVSHVIYRGDEVRNSTSIGKPNPGCRLYVLDRALRPVPPGMGGELYAAGDLLGRGYVNAAALTASRFVANPFHDPDDGGSSPRLYRTGDRARWVDDDLEFLGRVDHQVKIGGMRVELEEIERTLAASAGVRSCVAVVRNAQVHAYLVPGSDAGLDPEEIVQTARRHAAQNLPRHMVPGWMTALDELPTTANGKVDRRALPEPVRQEAAEVALSDDERRVATAVAEILGLEEAQIGPGSDFFALGGASLAAIRLANRLSREWSRAIPSRTVFDHPTVAGLTRQVVEAGVVDATGSPAASLETDRAGEMPASPGQRRMWLASQLDTGAATYTVPIVFRFDTEPSRDALQAALADMVHRHPALRTLLSADGTELLAHRLGVDDPRSSSVLVSASGVEELCRRPFDLAVDLPVRAALVRDDDGWQLVLAVHHSATDEASEPVMLETLAHAYRARLDGEAPRWPRAAVDTVPAPAGEDVDAALARLGRLPDSPQIPGWRSLPTGFGRPGATIARTLTGPDAGDVRRRTDHGATLFEVTLASVAAAVEWIGGGSELLIAAPVARTTPEDGVVGAHVASTLFAVRAGADLRGQIAAALDARADISDLISAAGELRDRAAPRIMVVHQSRRLETLELADQTGVRVPTTTGTAKFDVTVTVAEAGDDLRVEIEYAVDVMPADEAERFLRRVCAALRDIDTAHPAEIDPIDAATEARLIGPAAIVNEATLTALIADGASAQAHRVAGLLAGAGIGPGDVVAVRAARSQRQVDLLHGVVLAGAAYVPVDPSWPTARQEAVLADSGAGMVIGDASDEPGAVRFVDVERAATDAPTATPRPPRLDDAAYVLFTSGSSGRPKGVVISHRAVANRLLAAVDLHAFTTDDVILHKTPFTFDVSVWELFAPAMIGARQAIAPAEAHRDPAALAATITEVGASVVHFVPSMLTALCDYLTTAPDLARAVAQTLRLVVCSGEALTDEQVRRCRDLLPGVRIDNLYGPTEAAVDVTAATELSERSPVTIGHPLPGVACRILDSRLRPVLPGAVGDLYLSGVQLARGYAHRPGLTAERFVADPFAVGARMYDTGDRARQRPDGAIEYLGRRDDQVKVGGQRIELGDVEAALVAAPGVTAAAACVLDGSLAAVYVGDASPQVVRDHASALVPSALVPSRLNAVPELPVTAHGKVDRAAAAALVATPVSVGGRAPEGPAEAALAEAFAEVLDLAEAPVDVDFFELGGDSISGIAVIIAAQRRGFALTIVDLFEARTIEALATRCAPLETQRPAQPDTSSGAGQGVPAEVPVSLPAVAASARREGADIDAMTLSAPLRLDDAGAAERALARVGRNRPELRVRIDRRRSRLWRAFQLPEFPVGDSVDVASGRLAAIRVDDGRPVLLVHRMGLPEDDGAGLSVLVSELYDAVDAEERVEA